MTIAVTGLSGFLGQQLVQHWSGKHELIDLYNRAPTVAKNMRHVHLDLLDRFDMVRTLKPLKPDLLIHLAAMTHIDACQTDKPHGKKGVVWQINVQGTKTLAEYAAAVGVHFIYLSTECVFDGESQSYAEHDVKHPKNWYGETKSRGEDALVASGAHSSIVRSVVAYHPLVASTMFGKIVAAYKKGKPFSVVSDQLFMPTYVGDIVLGIEKIAQDAAEGVFHIVPTQQMTPLEFAVEIGEQFGYDTSRVSGKTLQEYFGTERAALRLKHACLESAESRKRLGVTARTVRQVAQAFLA